MFTVQVGQSLRNSTIQVIVKCTSVYSEMYVGLYSHIINHDYRTVKCMHVYKNMYEKAVK